MVQENKFIIKKISEIFQLDRNTIRKIVKDYDSGKEFVSANEKRRETCKLRNQVLKPEERGILSVISCNNSFIQKEIKERVNEQFRVMMSQATISRKLKKLEITRKILTCFPIERDTESRIDDRAVYASDISALGNENLVFLDETGFNLHTSRSYGYSPVNTKAFISVPANRNIKRSVMCIIGINGLIAYERRKGAYNHSTFIEFIRSRLIPYFQQHPGKFLVIDNASFHHARDVQALLSDSGILIKFVVQYSPELNPIEEFFLMLKSRYHE
ncbi:hypothetical protein GJ496_011497 [Pomphorhynchus laevis]|nr:hypothetical protein GJ496_011497 [Pomphorhynchus laevis]